MVEEVKVAAKNWPQYKPYSETRVEILHLFSESAKWNSKIWVPLNGQAHNILKDYKPIKTLHLSEVHVNRF